MNTSISRTAECRSCGHRFDALPSLDPSRCPQCRSVELNIHLGISENIGILIKDRLDGKVVDPSLPKKKRVRKEFMVGADKRRSDGEWMDKERVIDRDNDYYKEKVVDPNTGELIHHCEEKLTDHWGHGSDKKPKT